MQKLFYKKPIWGWKNDGSKVPYRLRGVLIKKRSGDVFFVKNNRRVPKYHWVVITADGTIFVLSKRSINNLYWIGGHHAP